MDLKNLYGTYKKVAVGLVVTCGLINAVLVTVFAGGPTGSFGIVLALALLLLSCVLPVALLVRKLGVGASLTIFIGAMIVNGAVLGVRAFPANAFAILAVIVAGAAATVLTLLRTEQSAAETKNRF